MLRQVCRYVGYTSPVSGLRCSVTFALEGICSVVEAVVRVTVAGGLGGPQLADAAALLVARYSERRALRSAMPVVVM
jgi:hypothetical protein